jgi:hypothetical protein
LVTRGGHVEQPKIIKRPEVPTADASKSIYNPETTTRFFAEIYRNWKKFKKIPPKKIHETIQSEKYRFVYQSCLSDEKFSLNFDDVKNSLESRTLGKMKDFEQV